MDKNNDNNNDKPITLKEFQTELDKNMEQNPYKLLNNFIKTIEKIQTYYNIVKKNSITLIKAEYILPKYILKNETKKNRKHLIKIKLIS